MRRDAYDEADQAFADAAAEWEAARQARIAAAEPAGGLLCNRAFWIVLLVSLVIDAAMVGGAVALMRWENSAAPTSAPWVIR